ncbi:PTS transporter subunit EIIB, partial [Aeromonas caviae]|uniref:PTS transporter subunit EIIB n=1 Tax=Aeromonas caviae TaxID=648 RepID=UPI001F1A4B29
MSKVNTQHLAQLIERIGGKENITTVSHCLTRLRFVLADPAKADPKAIETIPSVKGSFTQGGQFQVVIGNEVDQWYNRHSAPDLGINLPIALTQYLQNDLLV